MYSNSTRKYDVLRTSGGSTEVFVTFDLNTRERRTPDTERRKKPLDLFASGTTRHTSSQILTDGPFMAQLMGYWDLDTYVGDSIHRVVDTTPRSYVIADWIPLENRVRSKVRSDYLNLAQALAEYRQTANLFVSLAGAYVKITRAFLSRNPTVLLKPNRKQWSKRLSNRYLEYTYGISPLLQDMDGAMRALKARVAQPIFVHGKTHRSMTDHKTTTEPAFYLGRLLGNALKESKTELYMSLKYRATFNTDGMNSLMSQIGLTNPLLLMWELIPFSFVIDWWVNIGDVLQSLDTFNQVSSLQVIRSHSVKSSALTHSLSGKWSASGFHSTRNDYRFAPEPLSLIMAPQYKPSASVRHVMNGLALFLSLRPDKRKK